MTEKSYLWTTGGSGDGTSTYTQVDTSDFLRVLAACAGFEGVAPNYLNKLAVTGATSPVAVNTGGGVVDGKPYYNSASVNVAIPTPVTFSRIDRIVLRASWAAFTVRITRIAGTEAASPTAPAITQTSGTTYDIQLAQVLITTGGAITVTDERTFARATGIVNAQLSGSAGITGANIAAATIAAANIVNGTLTQTQIAPVIAQMINRQGGSSSAWNTAGTTTQAVGTFKVQAGSIDVPSTSQAVTFPTAFSQTPLVFLTHYDNLSSLVVRQLFVRSPSTTGFTVVSDGTPAGGQSSNVFWLAIGL